MDKLFQVMGMPAKWWLAATDSCADAKLTVKIDAATGTVSGKLD